VQTTSGNLISELRVRSCDVDSFGHVNNAVYLMYAEAARNDYMLQRGMPFADFKRWNAGPVLFSAKLDYKAPAHTDDELVITGVMQAQGRTRFNIIHEFIRKSDQKLVCRAELDFAFVDLVSGRPCRIPEEFAKAFGITD
jgi:acyl-CoA thioester hydrolase